MILILNAEQISDGLADSSNNYIEEQCGIL